MSQKLLAPHFGDGSEMGTLSHGTTAVVGKEKDARATSCVLDIKQAGA